MSKKNDLSLFDERVVERYLAAGLISKKDYDKFLSALPDDADNFDYTVIEATPEEDEDEDDLDDEDDDLDEDEELDEDEDDLDDEDDDLDEDEELDEDEDDEDE